MSNTTGATYGAGSVYPSGPPEITPKFWWGSCCSVFSFLCCFLCTIIFLFVFFIYIHGVVSLFSIFEFHRSSGIFRSSFHACSCEILRFNYLKSLNDTDVIGYVSLFQHLRYQKEIRKLNCVRLLIRDILNESNFT